MQKRNQWKNVQSKLSMSASTAQKLYNRSYSVSEANAIKYIVKVFAKQSTKIARISTCSANIVRCSWEFIQITEIKTEPNLRFIHVQNTQLFMIANKDWYFHTYILHYEFTATTTKPMNRKSRSMATIYNLYIFVENKKKQMKLFLSPLNCFKWIDVLYCVRRGVFATNCSELTSYFDDSCNGM